MFMGPETDAPSVGAVTTVVGAEDAGVTVILMGVLPETPPPAPLTVSVELPNGVEEPTAMVNVEAPEPGAVMDVGLNVAVAPVGGVLVASAMAELRPPPVSVETVMLAEPPCGTVNVAGDAVIVSVPGAGLKVISRTGWISILLGARPTCP